MKRIFISGPVGDLRGRDERINTAIDAAEKVARLGCAVFIPHVLDQWFRRHAYEYDECMRHCLIWIESCDALLRIPGHSPGADMECARAAEIGMPVFTDLAALAEWVATP